MKRVDKIFVFKNYAKVNKSKQETFAQIQERFCKDSLVRSLPGLALFIVFFLSHLDHFRASINGEIPSR